MAHFGVFCPPATGHVDPFGALGRELMHRGHRVTAFQIPDMEAKIRSEGLEWSAIGRSSMPVGSLAAYLAELGRRQGWSGVRYSIECGRQLATILIQTAPEAVRASGVDFLLVDQNEPAGGTVAEHLGIPFITVCTSLPINREPCIPPPYTLWDYGTSPWIQLRNRIAAYAVDRLLAPITNALNAARRQWHLPLLRSPNDSFSKLAQLSQLTKDIDFPHGELPDSFHYLGPFCEKSATNVPFPFERLNGKPLLYASLGTLQNRQQHLFRMIAEACAPLNFQLVLSLGNKELVLRDLPGDPIVVPYAPQFELFAKAHAVITHAGSNTMLGALRYGLPMVAVPITNAQPGTAVRLRRTGAAEVVPLSSLNVDRLRRALEKISTQPQYRLAAQKLQNSIRQAGGVKKAADIIERFAPGSSSSTRSI